MKIEYVKKNPEDGCVRFGDLEPGDVFRLTNSGARTLYLKTHSRDGYNLVSLGVPALGSLGDLIFVVPVDAKLVVTEKG